MKNLSLIALLFLAIGVSAQISTHIPPQGCVSGGTLNHCGWVDENGVAGWANNGWPYNYINYGPDFYPLPPDNAVYTDLTSDDPYPVIFAQANSDASGKTVTVILHGYPITRRSGRVTIHTAYITSGTVTVN